MSVVQQGEGGVVHPRRGEHLYRLPVVGARLEAVRDFYDEMEPREDDSLGVRAGKNTIRYGSVAVATVGTAAVASVLML